VARVFIGLPVSEDIASTIAASQITLPGVRWLPPESLHLTVEFLGELGTARLGDALESLKSFEAKPVPLAVRAFDTLPRGNRARVLCAMLDANPLLEAICDSVRACLRSADFQVSARPLLPHVTVARLRKPSSTALRAAVGALNPPDKLSFTAGVLHVYESRLRPDGAHYRVVASYPLVG
jgi:2'-5' RNA ligase